MLATCCNGVTLLPSAVNAEFADTQPGALLATRISCALGVFSGLVLCLYGALALLRRRSALRAAAGLAFAAVVEVGQTVFLLVWMETQDESIQESLAAPGDHREMFLQGILVASLAWAFIKLGFLAWCFGYFRRPETRALLSEAR